MAMLGLQDSAKTVSLYYFAVKLKTEMSGSCLRRCVTVRNRPTCTASLLNAVLVSVSLCYLVGWNEPAELVTVVNRS
jgi:hypothetical protein